jgi:hypothetical protein
VKATGSNAFQYFGKKDIESDFLVWIHFGALFYADVGIPIDVYTVKSSSRYFERPLKIGLRKFKSIVGPDLQTLKFSLKEL